MIVSPLLWLPLLAQADEPVWRPLNPGAAEASSFLSGASKYSGANHPLLAFDGDSATAWIEGAAGPGDGERIGATLAIVPAARSVKVGVQNGCQKNLKTLPTAPAPRDVKLRLLFQGKEVATGDLALERTMGWQEATLALPEEQPFDQFELQITSTHPGEGAPDACISEIQLSVDADLYNTEAEDTRKGALSEVVAARAKTTKFLAAAPKDYPFAPAWQATVAAPDDAAWDAAADPLRAALAALTKAPGWYEGTLKGKTFVAAPDGLALADASLIRLALPALRPDALTLVESPKELASMSGSQRSSSGWEEWLSSYKVERADDGALRRLAFDWRRAVTEHGKYETHTWVLVEYEAGRPARLYSATRVYEPGMDPFLTEERVLTLAWGEDGKVASIDALGLALLEDPVFGAESIRESLRYAPALAPPGGETSRR